MVDTDMRAYDRYKDDGIWQTEILGLMTDTTITAYERCKDKDL